MTETYTNRELLRMISDLEKHSPYPGSATWAQRMRRKIKAVPMATILDEVPGDSAIEKAKKIGVSRQTYYYWLNGVTRPNKKWAKKLANLTGYDAGAIRGYDV
jgi:hypothetical protein